MSSLCTITGPVLVAAASPRKVSFHHSLTSLPYVGLSSRARAPTPRMTSNSSSRHPPPNILIIGATGVIGTYITEAIVTHKHEFGRLAIFTSKKTVVEKVREICALESWGVEVFVGDLDDEEKVKEAYRGRVSGSTSIPPRHSLHMLYLKSHSPFTYTDGPQGLTPSCPVLDAPASISRFP